MSGTAAAALSPEMTTMVATGAQIASEKSDTLLGIGYNELTHKRDLREMKEAEQRANAEWSRRMAESQKQWQQRFDAENAYNHPALQAQRLREAGINPLSALTNSPTPSSVGSTSTPSTNEPKIVGSKPWNPQTDANFLESLVAGQRIKNESLVAEANANKLNAEADRLRGQENRDSILFPTVTKKALEDLLGQQLANEYQKSINRVQNAIEGDQINRSKLSLQDLRDALALNKEAINNAKKQGKIMDASYDNLVEQGKVLKAEVFKMEIANTLGVRNYERLTGFDYYTGQKEGPGLWDIEDAKALADKDISVAEKEMKEFFNDNKDITFVLDSLLKGFEIADIVNDDVFEWKSEADKLKFQRELEEYKDKRDKRGKAFDFIKDFGSKGFQLLVHLLPFIMSNLAG